MKNLNQSNIDGTRATQAAKGMMRDPEAAQFSSVEPTQRMPRPTPREEDPPGADRLGLTPEEIKQFREKGYLIKRGLMRCFQVGQFRLVTFLQRLDRGFQFTDAVVFSFRVRV